MTTAQLQAPLPLKCGVTIALNPCIIPYQAELQMRGVAHDIGVQRVWDRQSMLARVLEDVRNGSYRPRSPSPPQRPVRELDAPYYRPTAHHSLPHQSHSPSVPTTRPEKQHQDLFPPPKINEVQGRARESAFSRYFQALLIPGLPQVFMQPFSIQDALVGVVLMLVAFIGWIKFAQAYFSASNALAPKDSLQDTDYLQFWPVLLHVASLIHAISMQRVNS